jgi:hypothetical protein
MFGTNQSGLARQLPSVDLQPSQPGALGAEQGVYVRLPGADFPPAGAIAVDQVGDGTIAPGATAALVTIPVPDAVRFRMLGIGFGADDEVALRFLTWSIRTGPASSTGDTIPGYVGVASSVGSIRQLADIFVVVGSSLTTTIFALLDPTAVLSYRFICRVRGYFWQEYEGGR